MDEVDGTRKFSDLRIRILNWGTLRSHIHIESELNFLRKYWKNHVIQEPIKFDGLLSTSSPGLFP